MNKNFKRVISGTAIAACMLGICVPAGAAAKQVLATYNGASIYINGQQLKGADPIVINGTTYLPLRSIGEALDLQVNWDGTKNRVDLYDGLIGNADNTGDTANQGNTANGNIPISAPINSTFFPFSFERNSVDGITLYWNAKNNSGKTINYYTVRVYFYNPVGDPAYDDITGECYRDIYYVGPIAPDEDLIISTQVGYLPLCTEIVLGEVKLEYSDKTVKEFWYGYSTDNELSL